MMVNIGFNNQVNPKRVIGIIKNEGAPARRYRDRIKDTLKGLDTSSGRSTRSLVIMDSDHVFFSPIEAETLGKRFKEV